MRTFDVIVGVVVQHPARVKHSLLRRFKIVFISNLREELLLRCWREMSVDMGVPSKWGHLEWSEIPLVRLDEVSLVKLFWSQLPFVVLVQLFVVRVEVVCVENSVETF